MSITMRSAVLFSGIVPTHCRDIVEECFLNACIKCVKISAHEAGYFALLMLLASIVVLEAAGLDYSLHRCLRFLFDVIRMLECK